MQAYDAVRKAASQSGLSLNALSRAMGRPDNYLSAGASRGSTPKADTLAAMLKPCGYTLCALPDRDVPPGAIVIDPPR